MCKYTWSGYNFCSGDCCESFIDSLVAVESDHRLESYAKEANSNGLCANSYRCKNKIADLHVEGA